ncbi:MAG TPA: glycosyltransferase family 4 protein [Azospirillum sp.]|nr:glycosyltransferase family 4 protein [Azospirillum sp.]
MPEPPSILFINRVFPPDRGASGRCLADLAERAARAGWRVTVLADGSGPVEASRGVAVVRAGGRGEGRPGVRGYLAALARLAMRGLALPRHDVVVTMTDPPLLALAGPLLGMRHGAAVHWCHDLFPALLPVLGVRLPRAMRWMLEGATAAALRRHARVIAIGRCMAGRLRALGVRDPAVLPNWGDPAIRPLPRVASAVRTELGLGERFTVAYAGNFGLAHPLGVLLAAAADLPEVAFLLVGDGRGHAAVAEAAGRLGNVHVLPFQPAGRLSDTLAAADLHVAAMDPRAEGLLVPCKVYGALAAGRPCLFLGPAEGEAARMLAEQGCGVVLHPGDATGFAAAVRAYAADPARCAAEGARARNVAEAWDADAAAERFLALAAALRPAPCASAPAWGAGHG